MKSSNKISKIIVGDMVEINECSFWNLTNNEKETLGIVLSIEKVEMLSFDRKLTKAIRSQILKNYNGSSIASKNKSIFFQDFKYKVQFFGSNTIDYFYRHELDFVQ